MRLVLYLAFVLSGAAGLIYETIWSNYLALFVGHSAYAQVIVLAIFLGGMSVGALFAAQRSERLREPLLAYAGTELAVGILGLVFHATFISLTTWAYDSLFPRLPLTLVTLSKWGIAGAMILPQSVLLGATFPFMSAGVLRRGGGSPGRFLASLYFVNSLGAAAGALISGFYLIAAVGLPGTILAAALCNFAVAVVTYVAARLRPATAVSQTVAIAAAQQQVDGGTSLWRLLLVVSFGTAVASFIYEIAWIRMLSLVLGSATHSFELMLSAFILGLALGAWWARNWADRISDSVTFVAVVQWSMGALALATLPVYVTSFHWMTHLIAAFQKTEAGYVGLTVARYAICLAVMLPATFCAGITLPLITRTLVARGFGERSIGWVYGVNTLGSIAGVIAAALVLLPWLGLKTLLVVGAAVDMSLAAVVFAGAPRHGSGWLALAAAAATLAVVIGVSASVRLDRRLLISGVYRHGALSRPDENQIISYRDGRTATVATYRNSEDGRITLATNGKPDASLDPAWFAGGSSAAPLSADSATQVLLPLVTLAHAPQARTIAVIGHGSGVSSHFLLGSPHVERLTTIEIEPEMISASKVFLPVNQRVFEDPRSHFVVDDAKSYFAATQETYDLILSEPSNPWVSGVASLFTEEFYERVAHKLSANGVLGQWVHTYEMSDSLVASILAAVDRRFQSYAVFYVSWGDILIVASKQPVLPRPDWSVFTLPEVKRDLQPFVPFSADALDSMRLFDQGVAHSWLVELPQANSDYFPILDLGAERARYFRRDAAGFRGLGEDRFDVVHLLFGGRSDFSSGRMPAVLPHPRLEARALAPRLRAAYDSAQPSVADQADSAALYRLWRWQHVIAAGAMPANWRLWLRDTLDVEADLHRGMSGVVEERFYRDLHGYLDTNPPPTEVCAAVRLLEGLARGDMNAAASAADVLLPAAVADATWVPVDLLCQGGVAAKLRIGDVSGARRYFETLRPKLGRDPQDLRTQLLDVYSRKGLPTQPIEPNSLTWMCRPAA